MILKDLTIRGFGKFHPTMVSEQPHCDGSSLWIYLPPPL